jgi:hypothetical protein
MHSTAIPQVSVHETSNIVRRRQTVTSVSKTAVFETLLTI